MTIFRSRTLFCAGAATLLVGCGEAINKIAPTNQVAKILFSGKLDQEKTRDLGAYLRANRQNRNKLAKELLRTGFSEKPHDISECRLFVFNERFAMGPYPMIATVELCTWPSAFVSHNEPGGIS